MALTTKIFPSVIQPAYNPIISVLQSDNRSEDGFQHIFDVRNSNTNARVGQVKFPANLDGFGVFDASRLLESQVSADIEPSLTGITVSSNSFFQYDIQYGEEFEYTFDWSDYYQAGTIYSGTPYSAYGGSVVLSSFTEDHYFEAGDSLKIIGTGSTSSGYTGVHTVSAVPDNRAVILDFGFITAGPTEGGTAIYSDFSKTQFTGLTSTTGNYIVNAGLSHNDFRGYDPDTVNLSTGTTGEFITTVPTDWEFDVDSRGYALAFTTASTTFSSVRYILSDGTQHILSNGSPTSNTFIVPIGPWNINNSTLGEIITSDITSYSAYTEEDTISARTSNILEFQVNQDCIRTQYTPYQLIFMDRKGSFIGFTFKLAASKNVNIKKDEYKKITGSYDSSSNQWNYNSYDRGRTINNIEVTESITINSDYITEANAAYLEELFSSPEVYHIDSDGDWQPIIITNTTYQHKFRNVEKLINHTLTFEYAYRNTVQR